jgi:hypothetical protein
LTSTGHRFQPIPEPQAAGDEVVSPHVPQGGRAEATGKATFVHAIESFPLSVTSLPSMKPPPYRSRNHSADTGPGTTAHLVNTHATKNKSLLGGTCPFFLL